MNIEFILGFMERKKKFFSWILIFLAIHGFFGFIMFVCEEGMQTAMFGAFAYSNAKDWNGLDWHIKNVMKPAHSTSSLLIGFSCAPAFLMCPAYLSYLRTNEGYIKSMEARVKAQS